jgi:hypothetical protein
MRTFVENRFSLGSVATVAGISVLLSPIAAILTLVLAFISGYVVDEIFQLIGWESLPRLTIYHSNGHISYSPLVAVPVWVGALAVIGWCFAASIRGLTSKALPSQFVYMWSACVNIGATLLLNYGIFLFFASLRFGA